MVRKVVGLLTIGLMLFGLLGVNAQDETPDELPIIALAEDGLYAVSPSDGSTRLLVRLDEALTHYMAERERFRAIIWPVSPDHTKIAYTAVLDEVMFTPYEEYQYELTQSTVNDIFILDITTGVRRRITDQVDHLNEFLEDGYFHSYGNAAWSLDGKSLYFTRWTLSLRNRVDRVTVINYDVETQISRELTTLPRIGGGYVPQPLDDGFFLIHNDTHSIELLVYNADGQMLRRTEFEISYFMHVAYMNPMLGDDGDWYYGYYDEDGYAALHNPLTGTRVELSKETEWFIGFFSAGADETALRALYEAGGEHDPYETHWDIANAHGILKPEMQIPDDSYAMIEIAMSPDGQSIAFLSETEPFVGSSEIMIMDEKGTRGLGVEAYMIVWAPPGYEFVAPKAQE